MRSIVSLLAACSLCVGLVAQEKDEPSAPVAVVPAASDEEIESRVSSLFGALDDLSDVGVEVNAGILELSGTVPSIEAANRAVELAERVEGVVLVVDELQSGTEIGSQLSPIAGKMRELGSAFLRRLPLIGLALVTVLVFWWVANIVHRRENWFDRLQVSSLARDLIRRVVRLVVFAIGLVVALEILDATAVVGAVLGAAGLAGLAIGFAFKSIIENYLAGVLLSTRNPFEIGDEVELNGHRGKVARLTARDTVLVTLDGNHLRIPNGIVINSELLNFTRNPKRRFEFEVGVSVELDLNDARRIGMEAMREIPAVLDDPKPAVLVDALGDSTVILKFSAWLDQDRHDFLKTRSETIRLVKTRYDEAGIEMPEPIYRVHLREGTSPKPIDQNKTIELPVPGTATIEEDLSADRTIEDQIEEDAARSDERNLLSAEQSSEHRHESATDGKAQ